MAFRWLQLVGRHSIGADLQVTSAAATDTNRISAREASAVLTRNEDRPGESLARGIRRLRTGGDVGLRQSQAGGAATPRQFHGGSSGVTRKSNPLDTGSNLQLFDSFLPSRSRRREVKQVLKLFDLFASLRKREEGQTMAEYGVVLAVITIAVFGALALLSGNIVNAVTRVAGYIT